LVRQVLTESLALGAFGSTTGIFFGWMALKFLLPLAGSDIPIPRIAQTAIDARVLIFAIAITLATCVLFSLAPAAQVVRADLIGVLKEGGSSIARGHHRVRSLLVVGQITLGLALLVGAELLIANFLYLIQRDLGFKPDHLLTFEIGLSESKYNRDAQIAFCDRLLERMRAIPGVEAASTGSPLPLEGHEMSVSFDIEERPAAAPDRAHSDIAIVSPGYFGVMGIRLLKGRDFTDRDDTNATRVVVVNEAFARKFFPGEDAIGKRIKPGATNGNEKEQKREIVGIVANAKQAAWTDEPDPIYYFPFKQLSWYSGAIVLRTAGSPQEIESATRAAVMSMDQEAPVFNVRTGEDLSAVAITVARSLTVLMTGFAGIALLLTVVGLYGVLSYLVARRRREIGLRIALGAGRSQVLGLVLRGAMQSVGLGLVLGLASAAGVQRLLESFVFGIQPKDPMFITIACCVMIIASLAATYVPAMRAASVDPVQALRSE
jgi:predicted permease